jgi:hypothetical protein
MHTARRPSLIAQASDTGPRPVSDVLDEQSSETHSKFKHSTKHPGR